MIHHMEGRIPRKHMVTPPGVRSPAPPVPNACLLASCPSCWLKDSLTLSFRTAKYYTNWASIERGLKRGKDQHRKIESTRKQEGRGRRENTCRIALRGHQSLSARERRRASYLLCSIACRTCTVLSFLPEAMSCPFGRLCCNALRHGKWVHHRFW